MTLVSNFMFFQPSLFNTWHKLVRYSHHNNFLNICVTKNCIPKGLLIKFNVELAKDDADLHRSCNIQLLAASLEILKKVKDATYMKMKALQIELQDERRKLFQQFSVVEAEQIWEETRGRMDSLKRELRRRERIKLAKTIPIRLEQPLRNNVSKRGNRRFRRPKKVRTSPVVGEIEQNHLDNARPEESRLNLNPINLGSHNLTEAEVSVLTKGPSFCPIPLDINWLKVHENLDQFERRIRLAAYFHNKNQDKEREQDDSFQLARPQSKWNPPKTHPEIELFLSNIRKEILDPKNIRKPKDNLSREERIAIKNLKMDKGVIRIQDKGSRFVIVDQEDYQSKMLGQLDNTLHYVKLPEDPSLDHLDKVKLWCNKWLGEGQISQEIANWVTDVEPKPGTAFGNVKTHKEGNPLRLITSCCGTAIERLSAFTEHYIKPLAQSLPSFIKDTTHFINKIEGLNEQGPLPDHTLLVSWDVVAMFPNIDNELGVGAVRNALDSRIEKSLSTECIVEAVEICLNSNNCSFGNNSYLQQHGTAMGPKNACSYADLAMGTIDDKARFGGDLKPNLWWRYRDDIFDVWTEGLDKLLKFTEYINSLYPTIKFELVYSGESLNVLDLTLHLQNGYVVTDIYAKPTDSHLYLPFSSSHPYHCKKAIPYGVALRIKRNCSTNEYLEKACIEYKSYLKQQNYDNELVDKQFEKAMRKDRTEILKPKRKCKRRTFPLVLDYNPRLPDVSKIIKRNVNLLESSPLLRDIFPPKSIIPAYRRTKNLKDILAPSKFRKRANDTGEDSVKLGCFKCIKKCDLCKNYLAEAESFTSYATGRFYRMKQALSCTSSGVIYLVSCKKCKLQYVGSTNNQFKVRFRNHKSAMVTGKNTCEVATHFNRTPHVLGDFEFVVIEAILNKHNVEQLLLAREAYWAAQLRTLQPLGLNKRCEYRSKKRIKYMSC